MFRPLSLFIGLRYAYSPKVDSFGRFVFWLSMIGIMLGTVGLIVILSVMNGFEKQMQGRILQFIPQAQITTHQKKLSTDAYPKKIIQTLPEIQEIVPLVTGDIMLQSAKSITLSTMIGIDPTLYDPIKDHVFWGSIESLKASKYNIIIGAELANTLGVNIGDTVRVISPEVSQITPIGKVPSQRLFNVAAVFAVNRDIDQSIVYFHINDASKLLKYSKNTITSWRLYFDNPLNIEALSSQLIDPQNKELKIEDWRSKRGELFQAIKMEKTVMSILIGLIIIVAALNIITSLSLLVMDKKNEIAILKTQGLMRRKMMLIFIIQGASSGIIGTILGTIIGLTIALFINDITQLLGLISGSLSVLIDVSQIIIIVLSLFLLSIVATLYPAYRAASILPAKALRYE